MSQTSRNTSHPLAVMVQLQNLPSCCHPMADPGAELLLGSATPSTQGEACSAAAAAVAAERGDFVIVNSHFPPVSSKAGTAASTWEGKEGADQRLFQLWRMSVTVPRGRSWGTGCPSLPLQPPHCRVLPRVASLR